MCRGDELNIVHVIERPAPQVEHHGAPPVDYLPQPAPTPHEQVVESAKQFLQARFGTKVQALQPPPVVHLITVSTGQDGLPTVAYDHRPACVLRCCCSNAIHVYDRSYLSLIC